MKSPQRTTWLLPALVLTAAAAVPSLAQTPCANLPSLKLPDITIESAVNVAAGEFALPSAAPNAPKVKLPDFCRVKGTVNPEVQFELWLPAQWNRKYLSVGNGGMAGAIPFGAMVDPLSRGYAVGGTDTGHVGANDDASWAVGHWERVINYAYRGVHLMTQANKAIVRNFYGAAPTKSYFVGCSYGGKQALTEAQRYPDDFDGVIAGDPANSYIRNQIGAHLWVSLAIDGDGYIPEAKVTLLGNAVNAACDALDGVKDGVLNDPRRCHFDPASIQCKSGDHEDCFTAAQVAALRKIWAGPKAADGTQIYPGILPGGEAVRGGWLRYMVGTGPGTGRHTALTNSFFRYMVFNDPKWDFHQFRFTAPQGFDNDLQITLDKVGQTFDATNTDLTPFRAHGGKLIQYHGWSDPDITPLNSINYYESVTAKMGGPSKTAEFYRLFMVPGMQHCTGGPGFFQFDALSALEQWVEQNKAPEQITASHLTDGKPDRSQPLCAWPQLAKYKGSGNTADAANYSCAVP